MKTLKSNKILFLNGSTLLIATVKKLKDECVSSQQSSILVLVPLGSLCPFLSHTPQELVQICLKITDMKFHKETFEQKC